MDLFIHPAKAEEAEERVYREDFWSQECENHLPTGSICNPLTLHVVDIARSKFMEAEFNPSTSHGLWGGGYVFHDANGDAINEYDCTAEGTYADYLFRRVAQFQSWQLNLFGLGMPDWASAIRSGGLARVNGEFVLDGRYSNCIASGIPPLPPLVALSHRKPTPLLLGPKFHMYLTKPVVEAVQDLVDESPFNHMWVEYQVLSYAFSASSASAIAEPGILPTPPPESVPRLALDPYHAVYFLRVLLFQPVLEQSYLQNKEYTDQVLTALSHIISFAKVVIEGSKTIGCSDKWIEWFRSWTLEYSAHAIDQADTEELAMKLQDDPDRPSRRTWSQAVSLAETMISREWMMAVFYTATALQHAIHDALETTNDTAVDTEVETTVETAVEQ